jgi:ligand-binding SRPBCC domain-containing protein
VPTFHHEFTVRASLPKVAAFHQHTEALKRLTPPPMWVQLHRADPLAEGAIAEFTLWLGPIPIRWTAVHHHITANSFTDTQTKGPLRAWHHTHTFTTIDASTTRITDHIDYQYAVGLGGLFSRLLFGALPLRALFFYRQLITRRIVEGV